MNQAKHKSPARDIAEIGLSVALITVCAWISIPVAQIPITLQTFAVALVGALLGVRKGLVAVAVYVLMGLVGLPVFSSFRAGAAVLFGPTGGYILGFFFLLLFPALAKHLPLRRAWARTGAFFSGMVVGEVVCYAFGTVWFVLMYRCSLGYAISLCVLPYLLPDAVKFAVAAMLAVRLEKFLRK